MNRTETESEQQHRRRRRKRSWKHWRRLPRRQTTITEGEAEETETPMSNNAKPLLHKQVNIPAGLRVVRKHLGKIRSASSAVAVIKLVAFQSRRRGDSLLQQQMGSKALFFIARDRSMLLKVALFFIARDRSMLLTKIWSTL
uniref:Uncharacterized protein n=1 Tax=Nelumbo nucifera TaxID=4432 RepID=A0A822Y9A7_NELNU|nr:TPA_asm: hypothetical protein HUJ06_029224 [Nelumbo nucifera]